MSEEQEKELYNEYIVQWAEAIKTGNAELMAMFEWLDEVNYRLARENKPLMIPIFEQMFDNVPKFIRIRGAQDVE